MLNEEKIRLMTEIALLEKKEEKRINLFHSYFKSDYVGSCLLRSFFKYSVCAVLCLLVWGLYNLDSLLNTVSLDDLVRKGELLIAAYLAGLAIYLIITGVVAAARYKKSVKGMKAYAAKLRRLQKRYEFQNKTREIKEGSRHDGPVRV